MRKHFSLIACLTLPAIGWAQSSVTVGGLLDSGVFRDFDRANKVGTIQRSNVAISGFEDLGGGLKATFRLSTRFDLDGAPIYFPTNGAINAASSLLVSGQWDQLVYAIRQDITYKILDQAVIQDAAGNTIYNLAQQDMVALRAVMRLGFALPNPINRIQSVAASRAPFAVLTA